MSATTAVEFVLVWAAATGVWIASLSAWSWVEFAVAVPCALPCAAISMRARRLLADPGWQPPRGVGNALVRLPVAVLTDTVGVLRALLRHGTAAWRPVPVPRHIADSKGALGGTALVLSVPPGTYVVDVDPSGSTLFVHGLTAPNSVELAVRRDTG
jgi:multisubunit Na+/H+ antiporter MnhE subunit